MARAFNVSKKYTHFALIKSSNKILTGWEYKNLNPIDIHYYAKMDIEDMDFNFKDVKILTSKALIKIGINPFEWSNWNSYVTPTAPTEKTAIQLQSEIRKANTINYLRNR
jgi:hypothetical protein